jgi:transglutaminase-like putative cysteine protease
MAAVVLVAWVGGLAMLARRELFVGEVQRLAEMALRVNPGATYFVVERDGAQIGFASTTLDTTTAGIDVVDYFVADVPAAGTVTRASARSIVNLSRGLALRTFDVRVDAPGATVVAGGRTEGDTAVVYVLSTNGAPSDSQRIAVRGPILLPTLVPIAVALGGEPRVGRTVTVPTFDPTTMQQQPMPLRLAAESLFTVIDSARFDDTRGEWVNALTDTVRAWRVEPQQADREGFRGWVDRYGRVVQATQPGGITLRRMAYEIAFENWRIARDRTAATTEATGDIIERTAIAANAVTGRARLTALRVRLSGVSLAGYRLDGGRQALAGDTLAITRETAAALVASYSMDVERPREFRDRFRAELSPEPLLQSRNPEVVRQAIRIAGLERDPRAIAEKINRWVYDSVTKRVTFSVPNALDILRTRVGDCNEHTQLYVALVRSLNIPARVATGLAYVRGKFYYHAWPEVYLGDWVAVDPTFGQFPADAAHLRFAVGGLAQQAELMRLVGNLKIDVLEAK